MALDSHLNSLESFEMAEKILTQNNIFELTKVFTKNVFIFLKNPQLSELCSAFLHIVCSIFWEEIQLWLALNPF